MVANCVELFPAGAVGAVGVPVKAGEALSALLEIAVASATNSSSISAPLIRLLGSPVTRVSLILKLVALI